MKNPRFKYILLVPMLVISLMAGAQGVRVEAPRQVVEGNTFRVTFVLENEQATNITVDPIEGCNEINGPGISTEFSSTTINGRTTSSTVYKYTYIYVAVKAGTYQIKAATLDVNGRKLRSQPVSLTVLPPDASQQSSQQHGGQQPGAQQSPYQDATASATMSADDFFVRVFINKSSVYLGEAVDCTFKLYTRSDQPAYPTEAPKFDGFLVEGPQDNNGHADIEHYNGKNYYVANAGHYVAFPQKTGELTISAPVFQQKIVTMRRMRTMFGYQMIPDGEQLMTTPTVTRTINVKALPQPQPAGYDGAVGTFALDYRLSSDRLRTNEAATLTTILTGTGNIKYLKSPEPQFPVDFEQYTPAEDIRAHISGGSVSGTATTEFTFVPQSVGEFTLPAIEFVYFDPQSGTYKTASTQAITLDVAKGAGSTTGNATEQADITRRATDILHIHPIENENTLSTSHPLFINAGWYWSTWVGVVVVAVIVLFSLRSLRNKRADVVGSKSSRAGKVAKKRLKTARSLMKAGDKEKFFAELLSALWGFIGDRLAIPASQLSRSNISQELESHVLDSADIENIITLIDDCEMARYAPQAVTGTLDDYYRRASQAMDHLLQLKKS